MRAFDPRKKVLDSVDARFEQKNRSHTLISEDIYHSSLIFNYTMIDIEMKLLSSSGPNVKVKVKTRP